MSEQIEFIDKLTSVFERLDIQYMMTGSVCSGFHGQPRATNDVDIVISCTREQLQAFVAEIGSGCYVDETAALEAFRHRFMFNVIDLETGWKADLIVRKDRPYSLEEFARRQTVTAMGLPLKIATAEDTILSKLEWSKTSESELQYRDALGVAVLQWSCLDEAYLRHWGNVLGVSERLERLLRDAADLWDGGKA